MQPLQQGGKLDHMRPPLTTDDPADLTLAYRVPCGNRQDSKPTSVELPYLTDVILSDLVWSAVTFTPTVNHVLSIVLVRSEHKMLSVDTDGIVTGVTYYHPLRDVTLGVPVGHDVSIDHPREQSGRVAQTAVTHRSTR